MNAVVTAPRRVTPAPLPVPSFAARGVHLLGKHRLSYLPEVDVNDVLEVDFDRQQIIRDGLYLISYPSGWTGVRRFQLSPSGLQIFEGDIWAKINTGHRDMQVLGQILNVYRRTE